MKSIVLSLFFSGFILFHLGSCSGERKLFGENSIETILVDVDLFKPVTDASFLIDTAHIEVVALETGDECLIAHPTKLYLSNNKIIVFDELLHGAFIFNRDGSYHAKVHAIGNGPGEYRTDINDIVVSKHYIGVLFPPGAIMLYDFDGKYVRDIPLQGSWGMTYFTFDENDYYLVNNWSDSSLGYYKLFALNSDIRKQPLPLLPFSEEDRKNRRGWGLEGHYSLCGKKASVIYSTIDTIFTVTSSGEIYPQYAIDIVKKKLPDHLRVGNGYEAIRSAINDGYITGITNITETSRFLLLRTPDNSILVYDKKDKEVKALSDAFTLPSWGDGKIPLAVVQHTLDDPDELLSVTLGEFAFGNKKSIDEGFNIGNGAFARAYKKALEQVENEEANPVVFILKAKK